MGDDEKMRVNIPVRPAFLDNLGLRQAVLRTWLPIVVLLLLASTAYLPLQSLTVEGLSETDTEMTWEYRLYQDRVDVEIIGLEELAKSDANLSYLAGVDAEYSTSHGEGINHAYLDEKEHNTGEIATSHAELIWWALLFSLLLVLLVFERSSEGWLFRTVPRVMEIFAAVAALLVTLMLLIGVADYFALGDAAPEALGHVDFDGGLFGESTSDDGGGDSETVMWAPGLAMWVELLTFLLVMPLILLHLMEALSPGWWGKSRSSHPSALLKSGESSTLSDNDGFGTKAKPAAASVPTAAASLALLLLISALFLPWMSHSQTYQVEEGEGDWSTIVLDWDTGMFGTSFTNSTFFDSAEGIETKQGSTSGNASVSATTGIVEDVMFKYFVGIFLLLIPFALALLPEESRGRLGSSRLWLASGLLLSCWVLSGIVADIEDGGNSFSSDSSMLLPHEDLDIIWFGGGEDGLMGHRMGSVSLEGSDWIAPAITAEWGPSFALLFVRIAVILLLFAGLSTLTGLHENAGERRTGISYLPASLHGSSHSAGSWLGGDVGESHKVAFAGVGFLLILTLVLGGALEGALLSKGSSGGPALKLYDVQINDRNDDVFTDGTYSDGEVVTITIDVPASSVENATFFHFQAGCSDNTGDFGSNNPVGEDTDAIRIEIALPESLGGTVLVEEEDCIDNWSFEHDVGDDSSNQATHRVQARNAESAASRFNDDSMMISFDVSITPITKGSLGGSGLNEDDDLYFAFYSYWLGYEGQVSEVVEEEE